MVISEETGQALALISTQFASSKSKVRKSFGKLILFWESQVALKLNFQEENITESLKNSN